MPRSKDAPILENDPLWYKDAIIYQLHVRAFFDSNRDGIGDFRGLTQKLDYLEDLGVTALWLLPFYPSPLRDEGYDIADYTGVHPAYGTLQHFNAFLHEAHRRGLRVITELVINHTSDQHPWFQRARKAPAGSPYRDFYVWNQTPSKYLGTRIIFKDFESSNWSIDHMANAYYWHRFYTHQPDLNYDNPAVKRAVLRVMDFWLKRGVDGLRLDAVPYLYEREGTSCENLPETHALLKELRRHVDAHYTNRMLLAEANQWPEDSASYFGQGDECHMNFHFPLMPRLFMAVRMEERFPIVDIMQQTPAIPETCQWATFLRNHDELTLEMVTDEERDYMWRAYAKDPQMRINLGIRRRLSPLLGNDRRKLELLHGLLFSMPGTPVLYYGEEIGMGDNFYLGDRNGVRTPMQWNADRNAGFSDANPQKLYLPIIIDPEYHYEAVNVETQQNNPNSLLWWIKHLISLRKRYRAFGRGTLQFLQPENRKILAYLRRYQDESVLVVANLSRHPQCAELDMSVYPETVGMVPRELSSRTPFPPITDRPYFLTLTGHAFYWFALEPQRLEVTTTETPLPTLSVRGNWTNVFRERDKAALEAVLPNYIRTRRWFGGKARTIQEVEIVTALPIPRESPTAYLTLLQVTYTDGEPETYALPLVFATGDQVAQLQEGTPVVARLRLQGKEGEGVLYDAMYDTGFARTLFGLIARGRLISGTFGQLSGSSSRVFRSLLRSGTTVLEPRLMRAEQSNTSVVYGDLFILKLYRRLEEGINPDLEIGRYLTDECNFPSTAPVAGALEFRRNGGDPMTVAILQGFIPVQGDAWQYTLDTLARYFAEVLARRGDIGTAPVSAKSPLALIDDTIPELVDDLLGMYLETAQLLGQRTGEMHVALAQAPDNPSFAPEPFTDFYRQSTYQGMLGQATQTFQLLRQRLRYLPDTVQEDVQQLLSHQTEVRRRFQSLRDRRITAMRLRCHGDYHLGQVLYTGKDFVIIDFEGEPARSLSVRRMKRSPLRDVAGMLRSFHYAAFAALLDQTASVRPEDLPFLEPWARFWYQWVSVVYLKRYLAVTAKADFLPETHAELQVLLDVYLLEKALYELNYELNSRPTWVKVPLQGILQLLETAG
jgi:maltose alpha-D-glucosyltransferase/alpha-amylase